MELKYLVIFSCVVVVCHAWTYRRQYGTKCPLSFSIQGAVDCSGNEYSDTCEFQCNHGYHLVGMRSIKCGRGGRWSDEPPKCIAKRCPRLVPRPHAESYECTRDDSSFETVCWLRCRQERGFTLSFPVFTMCTDEQRWTTRPACRDIESPVIHNCPSHTMIARQSPNKDMTLVSWPRITVSDNSGDVVLQGESRLGQELGATGGLFEVGVELVTLTAADEDGNKATPCSFNVDVREVSCDPLILDDPHLIISECNGTIEGSACRLECPLTIDVEGLRYVTCRRGENGGLKGYWDWGQNESPPRPQPRCLVHDCPDLRPPNNGALACEKLHMGVTCEIQCQEDYDVPDINQPPPIYQCSFNTGKWNNDTVPDCVYRENDKGMRLPEYFYFSGECDQSKSRIAESFLDVIDREGLCTDSEWCTVQNVNITCGGDEIGDESFDDDYFEFE